ncbi:hypothetical protein BKA66DRAFT_447132 [Pyrenochaeta sp. MPI-SDFR-AT-0127]|nr:hypothetical protein BKA66DRAFT_447132 [Pyrenochaeta sp. MPI-SDFR-AT-0127]
MLALEKRALGRWSAPAEVDVIATFRPLVEWPDAVLRSTQREGVEANLQRKLRVLVVMATGSGKRPLSRPLRPPEHSLQQMDTTRLKIAYQVQEYPRGELDEALVALIDAKRSPDAQVIVYLSVYPRDETPCKCAYLQDYDREVGANGKESTHGPGLDAPSVHVVIHVTMYCLLRQYTQESGWGVRRRWRTLVHGEADKRVIIRLALLKRQNPSGVQAKKARQNEWERV